MPVASASAVVVIVLLAAWGFGATGLLRGIYRGGKAAAVASVEETHAQQSAVGMVEVPSLTGMTLDEASTVVQAAGFALVVTEEGTPAVAASRLVTDQDPQAGTVAPLGSAVEIVVPPLQGSASLASSRKKPRRFVVVIDPGHQAHSDNKPEPIGPGAVETKARVSGGATGVVTGIPESEIVLQICTNLQKRLEAAGVEVVMTRTTNDVNLGNSERAGIANRAHADLFVRVHADSNTDADHSGVATLYPSVNSWTRPITAQSKRAAAVIDSRLAKSTGAVDGGAVERSDLAGFNWSQVPAVMVEAGYLSNPVEDRLLASPHYQDEVARGISEGVLAYLSGAKR